MMTAMATSTNPHRTQFLHNNHYAKKSKFNYQNHMTIKEPPKPYADFQKLKTAKVKQAKSTSEKKPTPFFQLQGQWLAKAGFSINKNCLIEVYKGMLVITLDEPINKAEKTHPTITLNK